MLVFLILRGLRSLGHNGKSGFDIMATVYSLLSSDLRVNLPKDEECAKCSTGAKYRRFAHDWNRKKIRTRPQGAAFACGKSSEMDCGEFTLKDDGMRLCTIAI